MTDETDESKANALPPDEVTYPEEARPLSDRDRDRFLELLENPPPANAALRRLLGKKS